MVTTVALSTTSEVTVMAVAASVTGEKVVPVPVVHSKEQAASAVVAKSTISPKSTRMPVIPWT